MGTDATFKEAYEELLYSEFPDEALETAAGVRENPIGNITMYFCTALYFCPGP